MKPLLAVVAVVFIGFWMVQAPDSLAAFTKEAATWLWDMTSTIFQSLMQYLDGLFA